MKVLRFAIPALAALIVAACLPVTTSHPIGSTAGIGSDRDLSGIWKGRGQDQDKDGYIVFMDNGDDTMTAIVFSPEDKGGDWESYTLQTARLGTHRYMNARPALKNGKPVDGGEAKVIFPLLYTIANGTLTLSLIDDDAAKAAIAAGRIEGTVDPGDMGDVHITAAPAALDAYFTAEGTTLFRKTLLTLRKTG
jgi:hypothetical protein